MTLLNLATDVIDFAFAAWKIVVLGPIVIGVVAMLLTGFKKEDKQ